MNYPPEKQTVLCKLLSQKREGEKICDVTSPIFRLVDEIVGETAAQNLSKNYGMIYLTNLRGGANWNSMLPKLEEINAASSCSSGDVSFSGYENRSPSPLRFIRLVTSILSTFNTSVPVVPSTTLFSRSAEGIWCSIRLQATGTRSKALSCSRACLCFRYCVFQLPVIQPAPSESVQEGASDGLSLPTLEHLKEISECEEQFLQQIIGVLSFLLIFIEQVHEMGNCTTFAPKSTQATLTIPIYQMRIQAPDSPKFRLSKVLPYTNALMDSVISSQKSVCDLSTWLVQWLLCVASSNKHHDLKFSGVVKRVKRYITDYLLLVRQSTSAMIDRENQRRDVKNAIVETTLRFLMKPNPNAEVPSLVHLAPLPGALVHCQLGVSRSPTIVIGYMISTWFLTFQQGLELKKNVHPLSCIDPVRSSDSDENSSDQRVAAELFLLFFDAFRKGRPIIQPQSCFMAELRSLWMRLIVPSLDSSPSA